jgi:2-oxoisovalerate ferredoxin oxidoreductase beta subunit
MVRAEQACEGLGDRERAGDVDRELVLEVFDVDMEKGPWHGDACIVDQSEQGFSSKCGFDLAGSGGDGIQTAAILIATAAINEGFDGTHIPSYGPESRGGTSYADTHVAKDEVLNPASPTPDILMAFNAPSLAKFGTTVAKGGFIIYDSSVAKDVKPADPSITCVGVPFTDIARGLGKLVVKNIVALGALQAATGIFPEATFLAAVHQALKDKASLIPLNEKAFAAGIAAAREAMAAKV